MVVDEKLWDDQSHCIHPMGTMNVYIKFHGNLSNSC